MGPSLVLLGAAGRPLSRLQNEGLSSFLLPSERLPWKEEDRTGKAAPSPGPRRPDAPRGSHAPSGLYSGRPGVLVRCTFWFCGSCCGLRTTAAACVLGPWGSFMGWLSDLEKDLDCKVHDCGTPCVQSCKYVTRLDVPSGQKMVGRVL